MKKRPEQAQARQESEGSEEGGGKERREESERRMREIYKRI